MKTEEAKNRILLTILHEGAKKEQRTEYYLRYCMKADCEWWLI